MVTVQHFFFFLALLFFGGPRHASEVRAHHEGGEDAECEGTGGLNKERMVVDKEGHHGRAWDGELP